jgi:hypothetical protein
MPYSRPDSSLIPGRIPALFPAGFLPYSRPDSCLIPGRITALFPAGFLPYSRPFSSLIFAFSATLSSLLNPRIAY